MIKQTVLPFKLETTMDLITPHAGLALMSEFVVGLGLIKALRSDSIGLVRSPFDWICHFDRREKSDLQEQVILSKAKDLLTPGRSLTRFGTMLRIGFLAEFIPPSGARNDKYMELLARPSNTREPNRR